jgi:hypothetical protein
MPKINVKFVTEEKTSKAGHPYKLIEMWVTDRDGSWPDRPTVSMMPFHARLLLQNLPELCLEMADSEQPASMVEEPTTEESGSTLPF